MLLRLLSAGSAAALAAILSTSLARAGESKPEVVIGAVISSTGPAATLGIQEDRALRMFEETLAGQGNLPYTAKFVIYDDKSDPTEAVNSVRKLIDDDQAHVVICCTTTPASMAILETVNAAKVPNISMASGESIARPAEERHFTFRTVPGDRLMLQRVFAHMREQGFSKLAFAGLEDSYGQSGWEEFQSAAKEAGMEIVGSERFARTDTSFTPQALRLRQANPDAIYIHSIPPSANLMHQALGQVGFPGAVYHGSGVANKAFLGINPEAIEGGYAGVGTVIVHDQMPETHPLRKVISDFAHSYENRFGAGQADMFAVSGWDAGNVAVEGLRRASEKGSPEDLAAFRLNVRDAIESITDFKTASGVFNYSASNHVGLDLSGLAVVRIENGKFMFVE